MAHLLNKDEEKKINEHIDKLYDEFHLVLSNAKDSSLNHVKFSDLLAGSAQSINIILKNLSPSVKAKILSKVTNAVSLQTVGTTMMLLKSEYLAGVYLVYEIYDNIYRWWNGEISGQRATKNIIDSVAAVGGGAAGASAGAAMGSAFGPIGTAVGGALGAITGSLTAGHISETFTRWLFDLPKTEALEKAYNVFGVYHNSPNSEVNKAFRNLCRKYHPDKAGGSHNKFTEIQYYMTIIKAARGEKHNF
uniref:J domain-containing protein n=1 Tax=Panagrolaimus davidi TaxID=227884 RepID=A0A914PBZ1_9BILA